MTDGSDAARQLRQLKVDLITVRRRLEYLVDFLTSFQYLPPANVQEVHVLREEWAALRREIAERFPHWRDDEAGEILKERLRDLFG